MTKAELKRRFNELCKQASKLAQDAKAINGGDNTEFLAFAIATKCEELCKPIESKDIFGY